MLARSGVGVSHATRTHPESGHARLVDEPEEPFVGQVIAYYYRDKCNVIIAGETFTSISFHPGAPNDYFNAKEEVWASVTRDCTGAVDYGFTWVKIAFAESKGTLLLPPFYVLRLKINTITGAILNRAGFKNPKHGHFGPGDFWAGYANVPAGFGITGSETALALRDPPNDTAMMVTRDENFHWTDGLVGFQRTSVRPYVTQTTRARLLFCNTAVWVLPNDSTMDIQTVRAIQLPGRVVSPACLQGNYVIGVMCDPHRTAINRSGTDHMIPCDEHPLQIFTATTEGTGFNFTVRNVVKPDGTPLRFTSHALSLSCTERGADAYAIGFNSTTGQTTAIYFRFEKSEFDQDKTTLVATDWLDSMHGIPGRTMYMLAGGISLSRSV